MKAALLAFCLAGCATIPEGGVVLMPEDLARIDAKVQLLMLEILRLKAQKVPICQQPGYGLARLECG